MTQIRANNQQEYLGYQIILIERFCKRNPQFSKLEAELMWASKYAESFAKKHGRQ